MYRPPVNDAELNLMRQARLSMWLKSQWACGSDKAPYQIAYRELDRAVKYELARRRSCVCTLLIWLRTWIVARHEASKS
jgi:uncharacterized protein